jgi:multidrug efflux pump
MQGPGGRHGGGLRGRLARGRRLHVRQPQAAWPQRKVKPRWPSTGCGPKLNQLTGLRVFLGPVQDLRMGGRSSNSTYQYTLKSDNLADLRSWSTKLADRLKEPQLTDVDGDRRTTAWRPTSRSTAMRARLGVTSSAVDNALYNAYGQRSVATIYNELNQYSVIMEWAPRYQRRPWC